MCAGYEDGRQWRLVGKQAQKKEEKKVQGERQPPGLEKGRKGRYRPGTVALHEIRKFQKCTSRWVREITQQIWGNLKFHAMALLAMQEAAEAYIINLFDDVNLCAIHGKCITVMSKDIQLAGMIQGGMVKYLSR